MNNLSVKKPVTFFLFEILFLIIIGVLAILAYGYPLKINRMTLFCFTFGASAALLFNMLKYNGLKFFLIILIILVLIITPLLFKNPTIYSIIHHGALVVGLGIIIYLLNIIFPKDGSKNGRLWGFILWILAIAAFFMAVFIINGIILKFRHQIDAIDFNRIFIRALKFGPVLGAGIGLGHIIASKILRT